MAKSSALSRLPARPQAVMTGAKAATLLSVAAVFDALKFVFVWFWFIGPFVIGAVAYAAAGGGVLGKIAGVIGLAAGGIFSPAIGATGIVLAMAIGLLGWIVLITMLAMNGVRVFHGSGRRFLAMFVGFCVSEAPMVDMIPSFTPAIYFIIRDARKADKAALAKHAAARAAALKQDQRTQGLEQKQMFELEAAQDQQEQEDAQDEEDRIAAEEAERAVAEEAVPTFEPRVRGPLVGVPSLLPTGANDNAIPAQVRDAA